MFGVANEKLLMHKPASRDVANEVAYEIVTAEDGDIAYLRVAMTRKVRTIKTRDGKEIACDGSIAFDAKTEAGRLLEVGWLVSDAHGKVYEVVTRSDDSTFGEEDATCDLQLTRKKVDLGLDEPS